MRCFVNLCGTMCIFINIAHFLFKKTLFKKVAIVTLSAVNCTIQNIAHVKYIVLQCVAYVI